MPPAAEALYKMRLLTNPEQERKALDSRLRENDRTIFPPRYDIPFVIPAEAGIQGFSFYAFAKDLKRAAP